MEKTEILETKSNEIILEIKNGIDNYFKTKNKISYKRVFGILYSKDLTTDIIKKVKKTLELEGYYVRTSSWVSETYSGGYETTFSIITYHPEFSDKEFYRDFKIDPETLEKKIKNVFIRSADIGTKFKYSDYVPTRFRKNIKKVKEEQDKLDELVEEKIRIADEYLNREKSIGDGKITINTKMKSDVKAGLYYLVDLCVKNNWDIQEVINKYERGN